MVSLGVQETGLIHFEKIRVGDGVLAPAGAAREHPFNPFGFDQAKTFSQSRQCASRAISILIFSNDAEKAVLFIGNSSSEINSLAERQKIP
jgi:hypothetical protein